MNNLSRWKIPAKTVYVEKNHTNLMRSHLRLKSDLDWVGLIHSQINSLFLQSEIHHSVEISLRWDVSSAWDDFSHTSSSSGDEVDFLTAFTQHQIGQGRSRQRTSRNRSKKQESVRSLHQFLYDASCHCFHNHWIIMQCSQI